MDRKNMLKYFGALGALGIVAFSFNTFKSKKIPGGIKAVDNFEISLYAGKWYEIARFDFKFEKDLEQVTAEYSINPDNSIKVVNKGFNYKEREWKEAIGKAKFRGNPNKGELKVSFFGPFYSGYNVVLMDPEYENVLIFGESTDFIWILSRNKQIPESVKDTFLAKAKEAGYDLDRLIWTKH